MPKRKIAVSKAVATQYDEATLKKMTVAQLKVLCAKNKHDQNGAKAVLIKRLLGNDDEADEDGWENNILTFRSCQLN
jgi:hypothetical protein